MSLRIATTVLIAMSCVRSSGPAFGSCAQAVVEDWRATHGGGVRALVVTDTDGSIYVTGTDREPQALLDFVVTIKYDIEGNELWAREYALPPGDAFEQSARWIALDPSGNVLVTGQDNQDDFLTIKYDPQGNLLWAVVDPAGFEAVRVETDAAGNVYVAGTKGEAGSSFSDFVTVKYDPTGNQQWVRVYEDGFGDEVHSLAVRADGEVAVTGASSNGVSCFDMTTIRYGPDGTERWVRNYSSSVICSMDGASDVAFGPGGEVYVGGHSEQVDNRFHFTLLKYDASGNLLWVRTDSGQGDLPDFINRIGVDSQGHVVVTGISESDFLTIKYDASGNELWDQRLDFSNNEDNPQALVIGPDDAVYLTGYTLFTEYRMATVKYDAGGELQWVVTTDAPGIAYDVALDATANVIISGTMPIVTIRYVQTPRPEVGDTFCFGSAAACPCGNAGGAEEGCANSSGAGASISGSGSASIAADDLTLAAANLPAGQPALLFAGDNAINGGMGLPFGDGLRCAGGNTVRLGVRLASGTGMASWGPGLAGQGGYGAGHTTRFQIWYRDPAGSPCATGFNLSHGYEVRFH